MIEDGESGMTDDELGLSWIGRRVWTMDDGNFGEVAKTQSWFRLTQF